MLTKAFLEGYFNIIRLDLGNSGGLEVHKRLRVYFDDEGNQINKTVPLIFQVIWDGITAKKLREKFEN